MITKNKIFILGCSFVLLASSALADHMERSCAQRTASYEINDPIEGFNRAVYKFNLVVDKAILRPTATIYDHTIPKWGKQRVNSFLTNLVTPLVMINELLQGKPSEAGNSFGRFLVNTTLGLGGLFDFASEAGIKPTNQNFGMTASYYCIKNGPYIMLPIFGPSTARDTFGRAMDAVMDPVNFLASRNQLMAKNGLTAVNTRYEFMDVLDEIEKNSIDGYSMMKSIYIQNSEHKSQHSQPPAIDYNDN